jgi:hypothetical protein
MKLSPHPNDIWVSSLHMNVPWQFSIPIVKDAFLPEVVIRDNGIGCYNSADFSWKSALDPILALSTSEAELISVASCAQEVNFCRKLATELGFI